MALAAVLLPILPAAISAVAQNPEGSDEHFRTVTPLGSDSLLLQPAKKVLTMMLTLDCKELGDAHVIDNGSRKMVVNSNGVELTKYPAEMRFRFTVGSKTTLGEKYPLEVQTLASPEQFASHLHFRLKIFHGIDAHALDPVESKIIGVPPEMPYDERIYRVTFKVGDVSSTDRMMFEVLDDSGTRVGKFHLQLM